MTTLIGPRVSLRPARDTDVAAMVRWGNESEFAWYQWGRNAGRWTEDSAREWLTRFPAPEARLFIIEYEGRPIGQTNYRHLQPKAKSCEIGIGIGEPALWSKGLGREALGILIRHLQDDLGMHRITLHVLGFNDRAIAAYKSSGFEVEGIERDGVMTDRGYYADDIAMALIKGRERGRFWPRPVTLVGKHVRLEPLRMEHANAIFEAGKEDDIRRWLAGRPANLEGWTRYIRSALDEQIVGSQIPFVVERPDGEVIGSTRYAHVDLAQRTLEIGYTWYGKGTRRTAVNTEAKYLLLTHAFETLGAIRVWLQTDIRNQRSQDAIARIGAVREGELRNERIRLDGTYRTSVIFSIIEEEWPAAKARLEGMLAR